MANPYTKENPVRGKAEEYMQQAEAQARDAISELEKKLRHGQENFRQLFSTADKQLHENPWPIVTSLAAGCLFLGFIIGALRRPG